MKSKSGISSYKAKLKYKDSKFKPRRGSSLYLWTPKRKVEREIQVKGIEAIVQKVVNNSEINDKCPICNSDISYINNQHILDISCNEHCFNYHYHKNPNSGKFVHGHFHIREPEYDG